MGRGLLGGGSGGVCDRVRKEGNVGAQCWHLCTRGPERASPTPNLTDGETEAREGGICLLPQSRVAHTAKPPALGTLPAAGLPLLLLRGVSEQVGSASRAPTDLSCRTAGRDPPGVPGSALPRSQAVQSRLRVTRPEQGKQTRETGSS